MSAINIDALLLEIRRRNNERLDSIAEFMPDLVRARRRQFSRTMSLHNSFLLRLALLIIPLLSTGRPPKYIFQGLRHRSLIEEFPASEVMVLGGRNELLYCYKRGCRFHWIGYISRSFELNTYAGKNMAFYKAILFIHKMFSFDDSRNRYLFLWEDSQPVGLTLSTVLASIPGLSIVCIAHGMFPRYKGKSPPLEGRYCKFNLVWSPSQKKLFKYSNDSETLVLGLPYEIKPSCMVIRKVVLISSCERICDEEEYLYSYYHFKRIFSILDRAGIAVSFRPHPTDDINFARSFFPSVCVEDKHEMLSSGRMAFIGFTSSLLYEAKQFGNIVIALDNSKYPHYLDSDVDVDGVFSEGEYTELPLYLTNLFDAASMQRDVRVESLSSRLQNCIRQIDELNTREGLS